MAERRKQMTGKRNTPTADDTPVIERASFREDKAKEIGWSKNNEECICQGSILDESCKQHEFE